MRSKIVPLMASALILSFLLVTPAAAYTIPPEWHTSVHDALEQARKEGKKVLVFAGRKSCTNCKYMRNEVLESVEPPVKQLVSDKFIVWYCDVDKNPQWNHYAKGYQSVHLPFICTVDPWDPNQYVDRSAGAQDPAFFFDRLQRIAQGLTPLVPPSTDTHKPDDLGAAPK